MRKSDTGQEAARFAKFIAVGVMNTLVTLATIFILHKAAGAGEMLSNLVGYVAGLVNSFLWNRRWVFRSSGPAAAEALRFALGFGLCYGIQALFVWGTTRFSPLAGFETMFAGMRIDGYAVATILGMGLYTMVNFIYNRLVTFKPAGD